MDFKIVTVTPELAHQWLEKNIENNRSLKPSKINQYARDMKEGRWVTDTGEGLKFDSRGRLVDGQNRLHAIIRAGIPVKIGVFEKVSQDAFQVIDSGVPRSAADALTVAGLGNAAAIAAIARTFTALESNKGAASGNVEKKWDTISGAQIIKMYSDNPPIFEEAFHFANYYYFEFSRIIPISFIGGMKMYVEAHSKHKSKFKTFCDQMFAGDGAVPTIRMARKKLIDDKLALTKKMKPRHRYNIVIKAWNAFVKGSHDQTQMTTTTFERIV